LGIQRMTSGILPMTPGQLCTCCTGYEFFPDSIITEEEMLTAWRRNRSEILRFCESHWPGMKPYVQSRAERKSRGKALEAAKWPL